MVWSVMSHKRVYKRVARSQARASCAQPSRGATRPATSGASSLETRAEAEPSSQHTSTGEEGGRSGPAGTQSAQGLRPPSSFSSQDAVGPRSRRRRTGAGDATHVAAERPAGPRAPVSDPRPRGAVGGTSPGTKGQVAQEVFLGGRGEKGREGAKDLALSFSAVSLVRRGGTHDLALDQLSYWSGQTNVQNTRRGRVDQMGPASKHVSFLFSF